MDQIWPFLILLGSVAGFLLGFYLSRKNISDLKEELIQQKDAGERYRAESQESRESLVRSEAERDSAIDRLNQVQADRESLKESMQAFSAEQLEKNRKQFLDHAEQRLGKSEEKHVSELEKRHEAIDKQFTSIQTLMDKFQEQHQKIEKTRTESFSSLHEQVRQLSEQTLQVGHEAKILSTALKGSSQSRGRWGEIALENICEMAGMTEHCDFARQDQEGVDKRPDLVVNMPGKGKIPLDAKVPYADYDRAIEATDPAERDSHLEAHGKTVRRTMLELAKRDYPTVVGGKVDFTVMFIPIESVAAAAFAAQPNLQEEAMKNKILIATPVTLIALLKTVALYWQQEQLAENAQKIWDESSQLHDRLRTFTEHLGKVGSNLGKALNSYNSAVGSFQGRVIPKARSIETLTVKTGKKDVLPDLNTIDGAVRSLDTGNPVLDHVPDDERE